MSLNSAPQPPSPEKEPTIDFARIVGELEANADKFDELAAKLKRESAADLPGSDRNNNLFRA